MAGGAANFSHQTESVAWCPGSDRGLETLSNEFSCGSQNGRFLILSCDLRWPTGLVELHRRDGAAASTGSARSFS